MIARARFTNRPGRLKPRASEKMRGLIANNEEPLTFFENRPSRQHKALLFFDRSSADVKIFFCSSYQCDQIA